MTNLNSKANSARMSQPLGIIDASLRSILIERARTNSRRNKRKDNFHLALVIECGGMRAVAAGGAIQVLYEAKLLDCFDSLHGSSAGACVAAYFLAQQPREGLSICLEDICTRKIVNPKRFLSQPCMVDTDYIVDQIISKKRLLDADKIISEPSVLNIITTSVESGRPVIHNCFQTKDQLYRTLKATLRVPGPFEYGIPIGEQRHLDGGMVAPIPVFSAVASHATHILTVCTQRTQDYGANSYLVHAEGVILGILYGPNLQKAYVNAQGDDQRTWKSRVLSVTNDILVRPEGSTFCSWSTIDREILKKVEKESAEITKRYLAGINSCV